MTVLVTGGAGYIGAHVVRALQSAGREVLVVDDLSGGRADRIGATPLVRLDLARPSSVAVLAASMAAHEVSSVIHLAARKQVAESVAQPLWYAEQNLSGLNHVLGAMDRSGVGSLVFSSSAAVYGSVPDDAVPETAPTAPLSPYGRSKLAGEWLVRSAARAQGFRAVSLRYFNVAGAGGPDLGDTVVANLVTVVLDRLGRGLRPQVFGTDYPTPDGTCVRDYVHVLDLAAAHVAALARLEAAGDLAADVLNVGTGDGASVLEVLDLLGSITGRDTTPELVGRRVGDSARVVADVTRIHEVLGWRSRATLAEMLESAWAARDRP